MSRFREDLLAGGDPGNGPALDLRVYTILDCGVSDAQALSSDARFKATLSALLGELLARWETSTKRSASSIGAR